MINKKPQSRETENMNKMRKAVTDTRALNLQIKSHLVKEFKLKTTREGVTMTDVIEQMIARYIQLS